VTSHKQTTDGVDYTTGYTYNLSGALIEETYPSGRVVKNVLESNGELEIVQSKKNANAGYWNYAENFTYNAAGAVTSMQLGNGKWESTVFNPRLQPTQIALGLTPGATNLLKLDYSYGTTANNGNVLSQTITVNRPGQSNLVFDQIYTYDSLNRLKSAEEKTGTTTNWKQTYTFDRYGNRSFDTSGENTTTLPESFDPDIYNPTISTSNNRFTSGQGWAYDAAGNVITDAEGRSFSYDAENKQIEVENSSSQTVGQYYFDGDGKRVKKVVPLTGEVTIFVYNAAGKLVAEYSTIVQPANDAKVQYLTNDNLGSPRINTDLDGDVISRTDYMPYGEEIVGVGGRSSSDKYVADDVQQGFTGYISDGETELDFAEARMYTNCLGRYTGADPIFIAKDRMVDPQAINLYAYVRNSPLAYIDPTGEYFIGIDGKRVEYTIEDGKIIFISKNVSKDLQRMADLVSKSGSEKALKQFTGLANNETKLHFEFAKGEGNYGLHRPHDKDGNVLEWDEVNGKFKGDPAYIAGKKEYQEATISIFDENIEEDLSAIANTEKIRDPALTKEDYIVATFGHEGDHDLNSKAISTIRKRQDGGDKYDVYKKVEKPAYDVTFKFSKK
jgi:RHS repeat-associated protein